MSYLDCNFVPGQGLQVQINKEKLDELMEKDKHEEARKEDLDYLEEEKNVRTTEQQGYHDSGMRPSDFV